MLTIDDIIKPLVERIVERMVMRAMRAMRVLRVIEFILKVKMLYLKNQFFSGNFMGEGGGFKKNFLLKTNETFIGTRIQTYYHGIK